MITGYPQLLVISTATVARAESALTESVTEYQFMAVFDGETNKVYVTHDKVSMFGRPFEHHHFPDDFIEMNSSKVLIWVGSHLARLKRARDSVLDMNAAADFSNKILTYLEEQDQDHD